jgi:hypothetical protein
MTSRIGDPKRPVDGEYPAILINSVLGLPAFVGLKFSDILMHARLAQNIDLYSGRCQVVLGGY